MTLTRIFGREIQDQEPVSQIYLTTVSSGKKNYTRITPIYNDEPSNNFDFGKILENHENRHRRFRVTRFLLKHMKRLRKSLEKDCLRLSQVYRKYQGISYSLQYEQKKQRV